MNKKSGLVILMICLYASQLLAQGSNTPLHVGDSMPDICFDHVYNYPGRHKRLGDFKGKLVILDFWNLGCAPCIKAFPRMEKLQSEFNGKIQILLVNFIDTKKYLDSIGFPAKVRSPIIKNTKLPMIIQNLWDNSAINVPGFPFHIWINGDGKIIAMTDGVNTNSNSIRKYLSKKVIDLNVKYSISDLGLSDSIIGNQYRSILQPTSKPVFDNLLYSSIITHDISEKGFNSILFDSVSGKMIGLRVGSDLLHLFNTCQNEDVFSSFSLIDCVEFEGVNEADYYMKNTLSSEEKAEWKSRNLFSYEIKFPPKQAITRDEIQNLKWLRNSMKQDLERFFNVQTNIERRKVKCRILIRTSKEDRIKSKSKQYSYLDYTPGGQTALYLKRSSITALTEKLRYSFLDLKIMPFLDETGYPTSNLIDIELNGPLADIMSVKNDLRKHGLDIIEDVRELDVLFIKANRN